MMNWCNSYRTDGKRNDCYYHILAMAAYSNERVAAIVVSVLYRMLTEKTVLSKILCKWKQDSVVSLFLYLDSVFKYKHKLVHNQSPV